MAYPYEYIIGYRAACAWLLIFDGSVIDLGTVFTFQLTMETMPSPSQLEDVGGNSFAEFISVNVEPVS
jgi:hypothetical protein